MSNLRLFEPHLFDPVLRDPFDTMFKRFMAPMRVELENGTLDMRLDVTEIDGMYKVRADIPGVKKDDINVRIDGNIIQIDAEAKKEKDVKDSGGKVLRHERWEGAVSRTFSVAQDVDDAKATAKYEDGVLTLELPKKAVASSKKLSVQ
ncbi:MAG: Hsp20 family protein [Betaproteobacteria bacterium]